jgi:hypothetical protein
LIANTRAQLKPSSFAVSLLPPLDNCETVAMSDPEL